MLVNIIIVGLIPGIVAKPIIPREYAILGRGEHGHEGDYSVSPSPVPASSFPVVEVSPSTHPSVTPTPSPHSYSSSSHAASASLPAVPSAVQSVPAEHQYAVKSSHPAGPASFSSSASVQPLHAAESAPAFSSVAAATSAGPYVLPAAPSSSVSSAAAAEASSSSLKSDAIALAGAAGADADTDHVLATNAAAPGGSCSGGSDSSDEAAARNNKAGKKPGHEDPAPAGAEMISFESCMESCQGQYQHADIAFDVSQGRHNCEKKCARYHKAEISGAPAKRAEPLSTAVFSPPPPAAKVRPGSITYESCMRDCSFRWQSAGDVSQGRKECHEGCTRYAEEGPSIVVKKRAQPAAAVFNPPPPTVELGPSSVTYESCMRDCSFQWQSAGIAFDVTQGKQRCQEGCAQYAQEGRGIAVKRAVTPLPGSFLETAKPEPEPRPEKGHAGFENYEACMESCKGRNQFAEIAFDVSQGDYDCKSSCASYASAEFPAKREALPLPDPADLAGPSAAPPSHVSGPGFEAYDACMSKCSGRHQSAEIAFKVSQGEYDCESKCARYVKIGGGGIGKAPFGAR